MSDSSQVKVRSLPTGDFQDATETGWEGKMLHLTCVNARPGFNPGDLVEVQGESWLYLGEVRQCAGAAMKVLVEHALDCARLASMQDTWR